LHHQYLMTSQLKKVKEVFSVLTSGEVRNYNGAGRASTHY
jgi:hypothetical protein